MSGWMRAVAARASSAARAGGALVPGDPAAAKQGVGVVVDGPAGGDDDAVGVAEEVVGAHAVGRRSARASFEDHEVQLAGAQLGEAVRFADLGHGRDDRGLGDRQVDDGRADEPAQHGREAADAHRSAGTANPRISPARDELRGVMASNLA